MAHGQAMGPWSNTGPVSFPTNQSGQVHGIGRVSQIKFHPTNTQKVYAVSASGGVYTTSNNGVTWAPMSGTEVLPQTSNSAICINSINDQSIYLCLGDANYYSNNYGIYKSMNGGLTWAAANSGVGTNMAVEILMDPSDTNKLVAATKGGIYRTINGGGTWSLVQSGVFRDMKAKPFSGSRTLYAATATAFYYSLDFGATWTAVTSGLSTIPSGNGGMRIAVTAADTSRVYLATTGGYGVIFKSTTSGTSFTQVYNSSTQCLVCYDASVTSGSQGDYNIDINAHPAKPDELLLIAHNVWRSTNGGATWSKRTAWWNECHTDMHHIEWNPHNTNQIWNANDGGVWMSTDTLATVWSPRSDGLAATEIYHASQSPITKELISIGTQDNGELYYNSTGWKTNRGGDWTYRSAIDYRTGGNVWYMETGKRRTLAPLGSDQLYNSPLAIVTGTFSTNNARIAFVPTVTTTAFLAKDSVYRCMNTSATTPTWTLIKASTATIRDIASCRADSNILYVAATPNILYRCDNALSASPTWTTLSTPASISTTGSITTTRNDANVVFMSCGPSVYRSTNKGATWTNITGTGLSGLNIRRIIHDEYSTKQRLFVNAGAYLHYKDSTTLSWTNHSANAGLPTVANGTDLMIYNDGTAQSILRLATYGRGVWQCNIDDNMPPTANFSANKTILCVGDTARFTHNVNGGFTSLAWSFPGGTPSSSSATAPVIVYSTPGTYAATLIATNIYGSDTMIKLAYVNVSTGTKLQVAEGFEGSFPPVAWSTQSGTGWAQTAAASGFGASTKSIYWDNYNVDANGAHDRILLPKVDLSGIKNAQLKFDLSYATYSAAYPDSLQIRISTDCGQTWSTLFTKTGNALATAPALTSGVFVPTSAQWRTDSISLAPYLGNVVTISFENIGHYGQALYLDNINLRMSPHASFGANDTTICAGGQVSFSDSSLNATSWSWTFTGGTPATSSLQNPLVTYSTAGNYTVRLIATNSLGNDTLNRLTHVHVASNPIVNLGNDTLLCPGTPIVLNAGNPGSTYLFNNSASSQTTSISSVGTYSVIVTNASSCIGVDTIIIGAGTNPVVNLGNDTAFCPGSSIILNAGNAGSSYLYSTGATTQSITVSTGGSYSVRVTHNTGCIARDTINITASSNPIVNLGNDTALCPGKTLSLDAGNPGSTYLYSTGASSRTLTVSSPGIYSVVVTTPQLCKATDSIKIRAGVVTVPTITASGSVLSTTSASGSYQWFLNGSPISGATSSSYQANQTGNYTVQLTSTDGCSAVSAPYNFIANGIDNTFLLTGFELYPNPNTGLFVLTAYAIKAGNIKLKCYNMAGQLMRNEILVCPNGKTSFKIDWSNLPAGVYNLEAQAGNNTPLRAKVVIQ
jgi:PKD repeat protein